MKHNEDGREAESRVAKYLEAEGYKIIDTNWKTKQCEIDIIARKKSCIYFVEVKYRSSPAQGTGFEYITPSKMRQMAFAAEYWTTKNRWDGEFVLSGASVSGSDYAIEFIDEI